VLLGVRFGGNPGRSPVGLCDAWHRSLPSRLRLRRHSRLGRRRTGRRWGGVAQVDRRIRRGTVTLCWIGEKKGIGTGRIGRSGLLHRRRFKCRLRRRRYRVGRLGGRGFGDRLRWWQWLRGRLGGRRFRRRDRVSWVGDRLRRRAIDLRVGGRRGLGNHRTGRRRRAGRSGRSVTAGVGFGLWEWLLRGC
jgi:hypothetical protein